MRSLLENRTFLALLATITILFAILLRPFWSAIFWAVVVTVLFAPLHAQVQARMGDRHSSSALLTLLIGSVIVILPVLALLSAFVAEGVSFYARVESREIDPALFIDQVVGAIPFLPELMDRIGIDTGSIRDYVSNSAVAISEFIAQQALSIGRNTVSFAVKLALMLYLTFFLLRDGDKLVGMMKDAVPLSENRKLLLFKKFVEVTRATVKGNLLVAMVQGALGGLIFWALGIPAPVLWSVVMAFLSLIPAVGAALVWVPVAIYLYATGAWVEASVLVAFGAIIIGLADNFLRPMLVGRDTKLPDYIVLFSTMGGLSLLGVNGFVIGPLIAAVFLAFWNIFINDNSPETED